MKRRHFLKLSSTIGVLLGTSGWAFGNIFNSTKTHKMKLHIKSKIQQQSVSLFGGSLHENKPPGRVCAHFAGRQLRESFRPQKVSRNYNARRTSL